MDYTLVIGASENPERYSNKAIRSLRKHNIPTMAIGLQPGKVEDVIIQTGLPELKNIDTVTMYVGAKNQAPYYDYILRLKPRRIIFNPGAENPEWAEKLRKSGIEVEESCTLVMLSIGNF